MTPRRHLMLGLLFLAAVGILSYYTLFKTDVSFFDEKQDVVVFAEDARGLREGAPVLYAGVRWGKVTAVAPDIERPRERRVRIDLTLDEPIRLFEDHQVKIESASVLGGVQLGIDPGTRESGEISVEGPLLARSAPDALASVGELIEENREPIRNLVADLRDVASKLNGGSGTFGRLLNDEGVANNLSSAIAAIQSTFENAEALTDELRGGQGTVGKLIYDTKLYDDITAFVGDLDEFAESLDALVRDAREGKGLLGTLLSDEAMAQDVRDTLAAAKSIVSKVDAGEGTFAKLINEDTIARELEALIQSLSNPEGTLARIVNDPALYESLERILNDVGDATAALREQRGPLGMLVYDTNVRNEIVRAIQVLTGSLEEQREAAPISIFLSTLFLGI